MQVEHMEAFCPLDWKNGKFGFCLYNAPRLSKIPKRRNLKASIHDSSEAVNLLLDRTLRCIS